jgi:hypothetical protein
MQQCFAENPEHYKVISINKSHENAEHGQKRDRRREREGRRLSCCQIFRRGAGGGHIPEHQDSNITHTHIAFTATHTRLAHTHAQEFLGDEDEEPTAEELKRAEAIEWQVVQVQAARDKEEESKKKI